MTRTDAQLLALSARGDADAFAELHRRHHQLARRVAWAACRSAELAEDVAQEAFLDVWRAAGRYDPARGAVGPWIARIVRNRAVDAHRRAASRPRLVAVADRAEDGPGGGAVAPAPEEPAVERGALLAALADLSPDHRRAVFLAFFGGLTHPEVAAACAIPLGTAKSRIRMGLEQMGSALAPERVAA